MTVTNGLRPDFARKWTLNLLPDVRTTLQGVNDVLTRRPRNFFTRDKLGRTTESSPISVSLARRHWWTNRYAILRWKSLGVWRSFQFSLIWLIGRSRIYISHWTRKELHLYFTLNAHTSKLSYKVNEMNIKTRRHKLVSAHT